MGLRIDWQLNETNVSEAMEEAGVDAVWICVCEMEVGLVILIEMD